MFAGRREELKEGIVKVVELYCSSPSVRGACWYDLVEKMGTSDAARGPIFVRQTPNVSPSEKGLELQFYY